MGLTRPAEGAKAARVAITRAETRLRSCVHSSLLLFPEINTEIKCVTEARAASGRN